MEIKKVLELLRSAYTEQLYDRKASEILKFCKARKEGFYYDEIPDLKEIVETTINDLKEGVQEMRPVLKKICEVASLPLRQKKASDEYYCQKDKTLPPLLNAFKPILTTPKHLEVNDGSQADINVVINIFSDDLRIAVLNFLYNFLNEGLDDVKLQEESFEEKKIQGAESSPIQRLIEKGTKNLRAFNESDLSENIVYMMQHYNKNFDFLIKIFEIILICGMYRPLAYKFVNFGILKDIINIIFETKDYRSYLVILALDIIWNIIDSIGILALKSFANEEIINELKVLFENLMQTGYKLEDKGLRNEMLILINYLIRDPQALVYFYEKPNFPTQTKMHSFLEILIHYATIDEMRFYSQPIRTNDMKAFFNTTSEDLEFKKLIWSGILTALQSDHPKVAQVVKSSSFISSLILYIDPLANSYAVNRWSSPQLREIQLHCLSTLANVILYMKDEFYERNGLFSLTKFLTNTNDNERREKCLKVFANISLYDEEEYKLKISDEGMIDILLDFIQSEADNSLEIRELCFTILSNLCKNCSKNKKLFRKKNGIELIISALKDSNIGISPNYALYTLAILDCLWNAILGNRKNENIFLENEGLYILMEFLETCGLLQRKMSLSCLCYLIENPKAINYFCDWNSSRTMINSTQLLIKLYELEDQRFGVKYKDGILQDIDRPLNPKTRKATTPEPQQRGGLSPTSQKFGSSKMSFHSQQNTKEDEDPDDSFTHQVKKKKNAMGSSLSNMKAYTNLREALKAGENDTSVGTEAFLINKLQDKVEEYDLRAIIFAILYRTGFDRNELQPQQTQRLEVLQVYPHFKMGEIWNDIKWELDNERVKPTSDDYHWMMTNIEEIQDIAVNCVNTQQLIAREFRKQQEEELNKFYDIIRSNKLK